MVGCEEGGCGGEDGGKKGGKGMSGVIGERVESVDD